MTLPLPENIVVGQTGHAGLHNDVNGYVNVLLYDTQTQKFFLASPTGADGAATFRAIDALDLIAAFASGSITALGIGAAPGTTNGLIVNFFPTGTSGSIFAMNAAIFSNPAGASSATIIGFQGSARVLSGNAQSHAELRGAYYNANHQGSGALTAETGVVAQTLNGGGGAVTTAYGIRILAPTNTGGGSIGTVYQLKIEGITVGTTKYAIVTGVGLNQFGDQLLIVGSQDVIQSIVRGNATQTNNIFEIQTSASAALFGVSNAGKITVPTTITAPGTDGNQTINKLAGRVNIAAGGTTVTVTNSLVTANSIIVATIATNDTTAYVKNVVPGVGSFVINIATCTAEVAINWIVIA